VLGIQEKKDFELEHDTLTSLSGRPTGFLSFFFMQNGLAKLNKDALLSIYLSNEIVNITEKIKCFLILGRSEAGDGE